MFDRGSTVPIEVDALPLISSKVLPRAARSTSIVRRRPGFDRPTADNGPMDHARARLSGGLDRMLRQGLMIRARLAVLGNSDVAGYSRLMGVDEEGTLERHKALRRGARRPHRSGRAGADRRVV